MGCYHGAPWRDIVVRKYVFEKAIKMVGDNLDISQLHQNLCHMCQGIFGSGVYYPEYKQLQDEQTNKLKSIYCSGEA
jgi:hypothetical protein